MADNTTLDAGAGGDTIRDKDRAGVKTQIVGLDLGIGGAESLMNGVMPVSDNSGSLTVDNAGTFAVQDSQVLVDNAGFADGTSKVFPVGYIFDDVAGTALTENDVGAPRINANRASVATIEDGATRARYATVTASNALKVDASSVAIPVTDNSGSLTVDAPVGTPVFVRLSDGAAAITALPVTDNAGSLTVDNAGTFSVQDTDKVTDNAAFTDGTTKLFMAGYILDDTAGTALTENDAAAPRISTNRATVGVIEDGATRARYATVTASNALKVDASGVAVPITDNSGSLTVDNNGTFAVQATIAPQTSGGLTIGPASNAKLISANSTNATSVKASAGQVYGWYMSNANASSTMFVKLYNKASAPTVGTDVPVMTLAIPAGSAANTEFSQGIAFGTGIALAITTGVGDSDATAVAANDVVVNLFFK